MQGSELPGVESQQQQDQLNAIFQSQVYHRRADGGLELGVGYLVIFAITRYFHYSDMLNL